MRDGKLIITVKHSKGEDGYKTFSVRLKEQQVARIDVISGKTGRSRNELIGLFLDYALAHCELKRGEEVAI